MPEGPFTVEIELANLADRVLAAAGYLPRAHIRRMTLRAAVDCRALRLAVPEWVARQLGLAKGGDVSVGGGTSGTARRDLVTGIHLTHADRTGLFDAVVDPSYDSAVIGRIVMDTLDLVIDWGGPALVPRDPDRLTAEL